MRRLLSTLLAASVALGALPAFASAQTDPVASTLAATPGDGDACAGKITVQEPENVWAGTPPGMDEWPGKLDKPVSESWAADGNHLFNVTTPTWQAYLPAPECATGAAILVVPGGGFRLLAINHEGRDVARWLAQHGIAAFALKYRLVQYENPSIEQTYRRELPDKAAGAAALADAQETMRLIRDQASRFGIDADRVGAIGFSAGGQVVLTLGLDEVEERRPAFIGNIYGAFFHKEMPPFPPANLPYPPGTPDEIWLRPEPVPAPGALPPIFMAVAQDDRAVKTGFDAVERALADAGYRPEVHRYLKGGHGFGVRPQGLTSDHFIDQFRDWLDVIGMLDAKDAAK